MSAENQKLIERLYQQAMDLPATERERFLAEQCGGDEQLRGVALQHAKPAAHHCARLERGQRVASNHYASESPSERISTSAGASEAARDPNAGAASASEEPTDGGGGGGG